MDTALIAIAIYISGWFAARWMNRKADPYLPIPLVWFFSWVAVLSFFIVLLTTKDFKWPSWIKGKGWKDEK